MTLDYNRVPASQAIAWLSCGWKLFAGNAVIWIVIQLIFLILSIVAGFIPLLGMLLFSLFAPVLGGGMVMAADKCARDEAIGINDLFAGFRDQQTMKNLLVVGAIGLLATILSTLVGGIGMGGMMANMESGQMPNPAGLGVFAIGGLLSLTVSLVWGMAAFFGVQLVALRNAEPLPALKSSFWASLSNWLPLTVFGLIALLLILLGSLPFGLGLLVVLPFLLCSAYCGFKTIFSTAIPSSDVQV